MLRANRGENLVNIWDFEYYYEGKRDHFIILYFKIQK